MKPYNNKLSSLIDQAVVGSEAKASEGAHGLWQQLLSWLLRIAGL